MIAEKVKSLMLKTPPFKLGCKKKLSASNECTTINSCDLLSKTNIYKQITFYKDSFWPGTSRSSKLVSDECITPQHRPRADRARFCHFGTPF